MKLQFQRGTVIDWNDEKDVYEIELDVLPAPMPDVPIFHEEFLAWARHHNLSDYALDQAYRGVIENLNRAALIEALGKLVKMP